MQIFIGNLPRNYSAFELRRLVERELIPHGIQQTTKHFLFKKERLKRSEYKIFDKLTDMGIVRHGVALIEPDNLALRAVERLNKVEYQNNKLVVREFTTRTNSNDRRALNWRQKPWDESERRHRERRQPTVEAQQDPNKKTS